MGLCRQSHDGPAEHSFWFCQVRKPWWPHSCPLCCLCVLCSIMSSFKLVQNPISPRGRANIDSTCCWFIPVEKFVCAVLRHEPLFHLWLSMTLKESVGMEACALNPHWAHLWADKNRFKYCRPESRSDCPPNISIYKSLWCSWRTNNNYNRVLLILLRVSLLRSTGLVCLEPFGKGEAGSFLSTISLNNYLECTL